MGSHKKHHNNAGTKPAIPAAATVATPAKEIYKGRPVLHLKEKATLIVPDSILSQLHFLHRNIGHTEWSGMLLLDIEGSINDVANMKATVAGIYPCDIGDPHATGYDNAEHLFGMFKQFPRYDAFNLENAPFRWDGETSLVGTKVAQIHSHHDMQTFFSATDMRDLDENVRNHGVYISFIVNFSGNFSAKGAFIVEITKVVNETVRCTQYDFAFNGEYTETVEHLATFDFQIAFEVEPWWATRLAELQIAKKESRQEKARQGLGKLFYKNSPAILTPFQTNAVKDANFEHMYVAGHGHYFLDRANRVVYDPQLGLAPLDVVQTVFNHFKVKL